ncbi:MAG: hypothetical protein ACJAS4_003381 [Bacteriovoracaceae bacterium]|jgi:uncharacterized protein YycO
MAKLIISLIIFFSMNLQAAKLKPGDILLQPLSCWSCNLIQAQEDSLYSHLGIYIEHTGAGFVLEAIGAVKLTPLDEFLKRTKKGSKVLVRRLKKSHELSNLNLKKLANTFIGKPYDKNFLWDNFYEGEEAYYCSELVFKFFEQMNLIKKTKIKRMPFDINPLLWDQYFGGQTPRGEIGSSPEDFNKSLDFKDVFSI